MKRLILPAMMMLALVLAACGGSKPAAPAAVPKPAATLVAKAAQQAAAKIMPTEATEAEQPNAGEAESTEAPAAEATAAPSDNSLSLDSREAGLDKLTSYRMRWQAQWNSTEVTKTESSSWDWTEEYSAEPKALHWIWKTADTGKNNQGMELWQIGDTMYMKSTDDSGKDTCMSFSSQDEQNQLKKGSIFSPSLLGSLSDAQFVGNESVNGIPVKHYRYNEKSGSLVAFGKADGEVWVATDGGYVVKDVMNWQGGAGLLGAGSDSKGDGNWNWELSDANKPIEIKAPENCGGASKGLPVMKDATEKSTMGDLTIYKSASKLSDIVDFYKAQMPAAGWAMEGEPQLTGEELASLTFKKGGDTATVQITSDSGQSQVMVNVQKGE